MHTTIATTPDQTSEIRVLTHAELDDVNGGFIIAVLALTLCFSSGFLGGMILHDYLHPSPFGR